MNRSALRSFLSTPILIALAFVALIVLAVVFPHLLATHDPLQTDRRAILNPPSAEHWFGVDQLGRDVYSRVVYGARYSILIGLAATAIAVVAGTALGLAAGVTYQLLKGRARVLSDEVFTRVFDLVSAFPSVLLAMVVVVVGGPSAANIAVAIGIASIPLYGRVVRAQTLVVQKADFVTHSVIYGRSRFRITTEHVLPNVLVAVPVLASIDIGASILAVSGLSFLGLGPQPPTPEWGVMLAESRDVIRIAWWVGLFPGLLVTATVIALTTIGRQWQRALDGRTVL